MKTIFNITAIIILGLVSAAASADPADVNLSKSSLNVDFNKMIDEGTYDRNSIQQRISEQIAITDEDTDSEKSRVLDFVDAEMSIGESQPGQIVDRRYDSVGEATPVDITLLPAQPGT